MATANQNYLAGIELLAQISATAKKDVGSNANLTTTEKTTVIGAVNEVSDGLKVLQLDPVTKTEAQAFVTTAITQIKGGVPEAGNTLNKLHALILAIAASTVSFGAAASGLTEIDGTTPVATVQGAIDSAHRFSKAEQVKTEAVAVRVGTVEGNFDGSVLKTSSLPEHIRSGMKPMGAFNPNTETLPAATAENDSQYFIASHYGSYDFGGSIGSKDITPKDWFISNGEYWDLIEGGDSLTHVNGKTAENGQVNLVGSDINFAASGDAVLSGKATVTEGINAVAGGHETLKTAHEQLSADLGDLTIDFAAKAQSAYDAALAAA